MSYTKKQVDEMLELVEQEFETAMNKSETKIETKEEVMTKSEVKEEVKEEVASQTIDELYTSMNKSEKQAHYEAAKKAMYGEAEEEVIVKSEEIETKEEVMTKSEVEKIIAENEELKKSSVATTELLEKLFTKKAPERKSITELQVIQKSEGSTDEIKEHKTASMKKSEIVKELNSLDYAELSKSDRNSINDYCLNNTSVDSIKHLITE